MNGCVIPGTNIAVDIWKIRECRGAKLFFLTHLHGDHIVGLTSSWNLPIYCSEITGKLLISRCNINPKLVNTLAINESHLLTVDSSNHQYITVTIIDANHCPGAVMFLLEGDFGKILHTGDFRYSKTMMESTKVNHFKSVDVLYLDNTYCSPSCTFLTREEATERILQIVNAHMDHDVLFGMRNLGKEELLVKIALSLKEWITVPGKTLEVAEALQLPDVFVSSDEASSCRLRVVPFNSVTSKQVKLWNSTKPTIVILPTAIFTGLSGEQFMNTHKVFVIPYSDHSSYPELMEFVAHVRPKRIVPIVSSGTRGYAGCDISNRANMECFDHLLSSSPVKMTKKRKLNHTSSTTTTLADLPYSDTLDAADDCAFHKPSRRRRLGKASKRVPIIKGVCYDSPNKTGACISECSSLTNSGEESGASTSIITLSTRIDDPIVDQCLEIYDNELFTPQSFNKSTSVSSKSINNTNTSLSNANTSIDDSLYNTNTNINTHENGNCRSKVRLFGEDARETINVVTDNSCKQDTHGTTTSPVRYDYNSPMKNISMHDRTKNNDLCELTSSFENSGGESGGTASTNPFVYSHILQPDEYNIFSVKCISKDEVQERKRFYDCLENWIQTNNDKEAVVLQSNFPNN